MGNLILATTAIRCFATAALIMTAVIAVPAISEESTSKPPPRKCDIGPVTKTYGKAKWLVYSCNDNRSIVIVSAPGNPAMPFYFAIFPNADGYRLSGEGTGRKEVTAAAFEELKGLSAQDIAALIEQTKQR